MLPNKGPTGRGDRWSRLLGVRTSWTTVADGTFFCPGCGGDRNYERRTGHRRFAVLGIPLLPRGTTGPVVECMTCQERFGTDVLDRPTTGRFAAMLRDAVQTIALAVLAAGGTGARCTVEVALSALRQAGYRECDEEQLVTLVEAVSVDTGRLPGLYGDSGLTGFAIELHEALEPLAPHLAAPGRERLLFQGARIALADGPYTPAERDILATVGHALALGPEDVNRLLTEARTTPS
ncbi:TerB family tellurite resistance protein [Streptomyces sp. NPDC049906]|uniref:TerB family tellurite resistance protein n=1 Tax=Streptomyces sp. NPDC049906 TaxID=3155656 RepID=UPI00342424EB